MASFDDLAFRSATHTSPGEAVVSAQLFCRDCNEVAQLTTDDRKRCLICGCELEDRSSRRPQALDADSGLTEGSSAHDLESLIERMFASLGGADQGFGLESENRRPASDEAVDNLGSFMADQASTIEVAIVVKGIKGEVVAVPANFGPCVPVEHREVVVADPFDGAAQFANAVTMQGKIVVMERGVCTFAQKVLRAQAAGAAAAIIVQTMDVWPYTMTDSKGESKGITIPAFMLSAKHGKGFVEFLRRQTSESAVADIIVRRDARECVICQGELSIGMQVTRMPCQHMFHTECLHEWLKIGNSCPICRVEIPAKKSASRGTFVHQTAQQRGDFAWND